MAHSPEREALKKLFALSGNKCAFPDCEEEIVDYSRGVVLGEVCHIKGRNPNAPRYDPEQTYKESKFS